MPFVGFSAGVRNAVVTITFHEEQGSPELWLDRDGWHARRRLTCAWTDAEDLAAQLRGYERTTGSSSQRVLGPTFPTNDRLRATTINIDPFPDTVVKSTGSGANKIATYDHALLTVLYDEAQVDDDEASGVYRTERFRPAAEFLTLGDLYWYYGAEAEKIEGSNRPGALIPYLEWEVTWHRISRIPEEVRTLVGYINDGAVACTIPGWSNFEDETLLFAGASIDYEHSAEGGKVWDLTLHFMYRRNYDTIGGLARGWNYFPRTSTNSGTILWQQVCVKHDDTPPTYYPQTIYKKASFGALL